MEYELSSIPPNLLVDPEFDRLDRMISLGKKDQVISICTAILNDSSKTDKVAWAQLLLGLINIRDGNFEDAIHHLQSIKNISPPLQSRAGAFLAIAQIKLGRYEDARTLLTSLSQLFESCVVVEHAWAIYFNDTGRQQEAWEHLRRAILIDPSYTLAVDELVTIGFQLKMYGEVANLLRKFVDRSPMDLTIHSFMALALNLDGQLDLALKEMEHILAFSPVIDVNPEMLNTIKQIYLSLKTQVTA